MIKSINFSNTLITPQKANNIAEVRKTTEDTKTLKEFPKGYGNTNIAFCSRRKRKDRTPVQLEDFLQLQRANEEKMKPVAGELPVFKPYGSCIFDALTAISSRNTCLIFYNPEIDSKEIFEDNLRHLLNTNRTKKIGFDKDTPFIHLNLNDYSDIATAVQDMTKDVNKQLKNGSKTPILLVEGTREFFEGLDRPHEFINNSIFKKYPTILFTNEGYRHINSEDEKTLRLGNTPEDKRNPKDFFDSLRFSRILSKITFIENSAPLHLPSINYEDAVDYLENKNVQKHLITNGNNIDIQEGCVDFAIKLSKSLSFYQDHVFDILHRPRLCNLDTVPINSTIECLKKAAMLKLILEPTAKTLSLEDIQKSLPDNVNWFQRLIDFAGVEEQIRNSIHNKDADTEESEEKTEINNEEEINSEEQKPEQSDSIKTGDKKETINNNFEVVANPKTRFSDIGGMYNIKRQLKEEFIDILKNPKVKNSQKPSGILLSGPPGCGKTLLARAIAGEAGVPFISTAGSSFMEMYVGVGPKRVRELYTKAREEAQKHPSKTAIVFIDEVDAVAGSRENGSGSEELRTVNALLHEMDGSDNKDNQDIKVITIVATNHEGKIDTAFKRSGRIDLKYKIEDPRYSVKAREEILKIHSKELNFKDSEEKEKLIHTLAQTTSGFSGADLAELLKKANRMSLRINRTNEYVTEEDINEAKMQVQAGIKTDMEHTAFELKQTIAHEAGHAVNSMILEKIFENETNKHKMPSKVLDFITNTARGNALGATYFKPSEENKMGSKETSLADLIILYGGYAIESKMFDTHSAGVSNDLKTATEIIENAVSNYDFGSEKHYLALTSELTKSLFSQEIKQDIVKFAQKGMSIAKTMIDFAKPFIEEYVSELLADKSNLDRTISSKEFKGKFATWLKKAKRNKEYHALCSELRKQINDFCKEKGEDNISIGFSTPQ